MNDAINTYIWCCNLQREACEWGAKFGIEDVDILGFFSADDLAAFRECAEYVEGNFREAIAESGVKLDEYETIEEFLLTN